MRLALSVIIKKKSNFSGNLLVSRERLETKVQKAKHILCLGDYRGAIEFHQQSLCSYRKRDWRKRLRRKSICNFGIAYYCLGDYKKVIEFHQQSLSIAKEIGEKGSEGTAYSLALRITLSVIIKRQSNFVSSLLVPQKRQEPWLCVLLSRRL